MSISFRKELKDIAAYKPGKPIEDVKREYGIKHVIKLASNENPLGCSPKAVEAVKKAADQLAIYPDGNCTLLKEALANKLGLKPTQILPSSGSDEMIDQIAKTFMNKDDEIILADITFPRYITTTKMMGAKPVIVPLKNWTYGLDGMLNAITEKTKLIWLCNPNNPTGTMFSEEELLNFLDKVPSNIVVVYDEAYNEYVTRDDFPRNSIKLLDKYPNIIIMRTFSKIYGLAALRIGYTMASEEIIHNINKIRGPFNVNTMAQVAALAALEDEDFVKRSYEMNKEGKEYLYKELNKMGIEYVPSETNHIFMNVNKDANEVFEALQRKGVIIRPITGTWIRVTIGTQEQNEVFIKCLNEVI
ncbi:histidinol-phosphate transaminase [Caldisalinibacter kiritimatiensis]|uniref:Histidinol-phosphate aminotransferase n=1 Tax=Caldisalinibacter kiritimatiensis TaxID=1304284 RepID=R1AVB5_9FIRM|nr:histidinol-phosphate transaminase [Caldisalinibacter kiritimatiensis]EOD01143.1 Biosynthetic Aromatic amino acid aminotransferase beta / Histidinol-phosphate aminotransferase [Caldisalinibacter kiritimatiensis]